MKLSNRVGNSQLERLGGVPGSTEGFCSFSSVDLRAIELCSLAGW